MNRSYFLLFCLVTSFSFAMQKTWECYNRFQDSIQQDNVDEVERIFHSLNAEGWKGSIRSRDNNSTLLTDAMNGEKNNVAQYLAENFPDFDFVDVIGWNELFFAIDYAQNTKDDSIALTLINKCKKSDYLEQEESNAIPKKHAPNKYTPLTFAERYNRPKIAEAIRNRLQQLSS